MEDTMDQVDQIIAYENGELSDDDILALFQDLVNSGLCWQLQGSYGRMAARLLDAGLIRDPASTPGAHRARAQR
jgi:hypothetical protein